MPFINSVISWHCPLLSTAVLLCLNYLLIESINKTNWINHVSISILAIVSVDYYHRLTLLQSRYIKYLAKIPFLVHGNYCNGEKECQDFIGNIPYFFYTFVRSTGLICSYFIPDSILVHVVIVMLAAAGLLIEQYISFVNVIVLCANLLIIAGGLHRLDLLKYLLLPLVHIHNACNSYLEAVADSANQLEDNFVKELNSTDATDMTTHNRSLLTAAMAEMYLPETYLREAETDDDEAIVSGRSRGLSQGKFLVPPENDESDCDSILINRSRMPSPSRSFSSTEDLGPGHIDHSLLFSDEEEKTEHSNSTSPPTLAGDTNLRRHQPQRQSPNPAKPSKGVYKRSHKEDFEIVPRTCNEPPETQPTSQQIDSQGPFVYYYTRARAKKT